MKKRIFTIISTILILSTFGFNIFANTIEGSVNNSALSLNYFRPRLSNVFNIEYNGIIEPPINNPDYSEIVQRNIIINNTLNYANFENGNRDNTEANEQITLKDYNGYNDTAGTINYYIENSKLIENSTYENETWQNSYNIETEYLGSEGAISTLKKKYIVISDFYIWDDETFEFDNEISNPTLSEINITIKEKSGKFESAQFLYRNVDTGILRNETILPNENTNFTETQINPYASMLEVVSEKKLIHVDKLILTIDDSELDISRKYIAYEATSTYSSKIDEYINYLRGVSSNPAIDLAPFTKSLATAVAGFFDFEIFPGFNLGGILITIIAFACVVWWLKLVAGG